MKRFQERFVFQAHSRWCHSALGSRVTKKENSFGLRVPGSASQGSYLNVGGEGGGHSLERDRMLAPDRHVPTVHLWYRGISLIRKRTPL